MDKKTKQFFVAALVSIAAALIACLIVASCLSCKNRLMPPLPKLTDEQRRLQEKASWEALMTTHDWVPQINALASGVSPFDESPASIRIDRGDGQELVAAFVANGFAVAHGVVECSGGTGKLTVRDVEYRMTFSKNPDGSEPVIAIYYDDISPTCYSMADRPQD